MPPCILGLRRASLPALHSPRLEARGEAGALHCLQRGLEPLAVERELVRGNALVAATVRLLELLLQEVRPAVRGKGVCPGPRGAPAQFAAEPRHELALAQVAIVVFVKVAELLRQFCQLGISRRGAEGESPGTPQGGALRSPRAPVASGSDEPLLLILEPQYGHGEHELLAAGCSL